MREPIYTGTLAPEPTINPFCIPMALAKWCVECNSIFYEAETCPSCTNRLNLMNLTEFFKERESAKKPIQKEVVIQNRDRGKYASLYIS